MAGASFARKAGTRRLGQAAFATFVAPFIACKYTSRSVSSSSRSFWSCLRDRTTGLTLTEIPGEGRKLESALQAEFERVRPLILGALLDIVTHGLSRLPTTALTQYPRMADFAHWMAACETAVWPASTFARAYAGNRDAVVAASMEADAVATAIVTLVELEHEWKGTAKALLTRLGTLVGETVQRAKDWPSSPKAMGGRLRRATPILRGSGVEVTQPPRNDKTRTWTLIHQPRQQGDLTAQNAQQPEIEELR